MRLIFDLRETRKGIWFTRTRFQGHSAIATASLKHLVIALHAIVERPIVDPENWTAIMPSTRGGIRRVQNGGEEESYERV